MSFCIVVYKDTVTHLQLGLQASCLVTMQNALLGLRLPSQEGQLRLSLCQSSQAWKLITLSLLFRRDVVVVVEEKVLQMGAVDAG